MSVVFIVTKGNKTNNTNDNEWFINLKEIIERKGT